MQSEHRTGYLERTVGELVAEDYARAAVFAEAGIDFCCGGGRTVAQACDEAGASASLLVGALEAVDAAAVHGAPGTDLRAWPLDRLVGHIEDVHHTFLRRTLPVLRQWTEKIARVHGAAHPELLEVRTLVEELEQELVRHLKDEEEELFPVVASLETPAGDDGGRAPLPGTILEALEDDHEHAGSVVHRVRELTHGYAPPADACATYAATLALLGELEEDLHRHVHLENHVLFPRARAILAGRADVAAGQAQGC